MASRSLRESTSMAFKMAADRLVAAYVEIHGPRFAKIANAAGLTEGDRVEAARGFTVCGREHEWWECPAPTFNEAMAAALVLPDPDPDAWAEICGEAETSTAPALEAGRIALAQLLADWSA